MGSENIYQQFQNPVRSVADYLGDMDKQEQNQLTLAASRMTAKKAQQADADEQALKQIYMQSGGDQNAIMKALYGQGMGTQANALNKEMIANKQATAMTDQAAAHAKNYTASTEKTEFETRKAKNEFGIQKMTGVLALPVIKDTDIARMAQDFMSYPGSEPEKILAGIAGLPPESDQVGRRQSIEALLRGNMSAKEQMNYVAPDANTVASNTQSGLNSERTAASSKYSADSTARSAAAGRAQAEKHYQTTRNDGLNAPKGQIYQSDQGLMVVDPRTRTAQPVTANGQPLQPKLKDLPATMSKSLMENNAALLKIDSALAAIEAYPDALGVKNYLGDTVRQRSDPNGIKARALVADIGSLKVHDRSGAAVTASETPRLKPFIPSATDDAATVKQKLQLFQKEYQAIEDDIRGTYSREQGYKAPPARPKKATQAADGAYSDAEKEARFQAYKASQK